MIVLNFLTNLSNAAFFTILSLATLIIRFLISRKSFNGSIPRLSTVALKISNLTFAVRLDVSTLVTFFKVDLIA